MTDEEIIKKKLEIQTKIQELYLTISTPLCELFDELNDLRVICDHNETNLVDGDYGEEFEECLICGGQV